MKLVFFVFIFCLSYQHEVEGFSGSCHYFSKNKMDWFEALFTCQKLKLCLANMDSKRSFEDIGKKLTGEHRDEYWFGLIGYGKYFLKYVSEDRALTFMPSDSTVHMDKPCAFLKPVGKYNYAIETGKCGQRRRFVCSPAVTCNGLKTNSTFIPKFSVNLPYEIPDDVKEILEFKKDQI